jgi:hypothetical protein
MSDVMASPATTPAETTSSPTATIPTPATNETPATIVGAPAAPAAEAFVPLTAEAFTLPEGFALDEKPMGSFLEIMNNRELTPQQQAQSLLELQASLATAASEAGSAKWNETQQAWQTAIEADQEIGGANLPKTISNIGGLMDRFGNDDLRAYMNESGAGNNPHLVRFLNTLAGQLGEATIVPAGSPAGGGGERTLADRIFQGAK